MLEWEAPVILKFYDLMLWTMNHTARFPRHHRYSLGNRIEARYQRNNAKTFASQLGLCSCLHPASAGVIGSKK